MKILLVNQPLNNRGDESAQRSPSACNRQAWKTHIYFGDNSHNLLKWQGGAVEDLRKRSIVRLS